MLRKLLIVAPILLVIIGLAAGGMLLLFYHYGNLRQAVIDKVGAGLSADKQELNAIQRALGFERPRTYLILFLNNTELRPAGGFIGAYAVVRIENGQSSIIKVEGTEILDNAAPADFVSFPPAPLAEYLKVKKWYFRDSNWSPDFALAARKSLELYGKEGGMEARNIDAVIGFTPTVVEEILKISGPVQLNGEEFNDRNFTEKLEYEVEYNYAKRGLDFAQRKKMLYDLSHALLSRLRRDVFMRWKSYTQLAERMLKERQLVIYALNDEEQEILSFKNWGGEMRATEGDYLFWVDANLGAMKTDIYVRRSLLYAITPTSSHRFVAEARMKYEHFGKFDWRTTRYRTYTRIFFPPGSELFSVDGAMSRDRSEEPGPVDQGEENGRQWIGAFVSIEPGKSRELSFKFYLSPEATKDIERGLYNLFVQKQIGTIATELTLSLDFGKTIVSAAPAEAVEKQGDGAYDLETDLREDRGFEIKF